MTDGTPRFATELDVAIVGGGPAGLAAAFWLGRYRRRVHVYDADDPRNSAAWAVHGYPGLPDLPPGELRRRLREQALTAGARVIRANVRAITGEKNAFRVEPESGPPVTARRILLAYGRRDEVPDIPGLTEAYGRSVYHCPDCDGPSVADAPVGVIGWTRSAAMLALFLLTWTDRVTLLTHGRGLEHDDRTRDALRRYHVALRDGRIRRVVQEQGQVSRVDFEDGSTLPVRHLFFKIGSAPGADLALRLGCSIAANGRLEVDAGQETSVPGIHAAGDLAGHPHLAINAAAEGVRAALAIHRSLLPPDFEL